MMASQWQKSRRVDRKMKPFRTDRTQPWPCSIRSDRLLDDLLSAGIIKPRLPGHVIKQPPVQIEERPPALLVVEVAEPAQQRAPCQQGIVSRTAHANHSNLLPVAFARVATFFHVGTGRTRLAQLRFG